MHLSETGAGSSEKGETGGITDDAKGELVSDGEREANGRVVEPDLKTFASGIEGDEDDEEGKDSDGDISSKDDDSVDEASSTDSDAETSSTVSFPAAPTPKNTVIDPTTTTIHLPDGTGTRSGEWAVHPDYADVFEPGRPIGVQSESRESTRTHREDGITKTKKDRTIDAYSVDGSEACSPIHVHDPATSHSIGPESPSQASTDQYYVPSSLHSGAPLLSPFLTNDSYKSGLGDPTLSVLTMDSNTPVNQPHQHLPSVRIHPDSFNHTVRDRQTTTTGSSGWAHLGSVFSRRSSESGAISMTPDEKQRLRDEKRLEQLGYSQVLGRDYGFWSNFAVGFCNIGAVQGSVFGILTTFKYGGPRMILTMWPIAGLFLTIITLSMGELASAYPVAGAMSTWTWKTARGGVGGERIWGWLMGGFVMGYHVGIMALLPWQIANFLKGTLLLAVPSYHSETWHVMLFTLAMLVVFGLVGTSRWGRSPKFWVGAGLYIFAVWMVICVALLAKEGGRRSPSAVFNQPFSNETGFESKPYVYIIGWVLTSIATGADACAHLSEETQNPVRVVPLAMLASVVATYVLGYIAIFILLLAIDPASLDELRSHALPAAYIIKHSIGTTGTTIICSATLIAFAIQAIAQLQASSRFIWAIARDQAIPFSKYLYQSDKNRLPTSATWLVLVLSAPICFVLWPFPEISLSVLSVAGGTFCLISYVCPILLYLLSDIDLEAEYRSGWSLRSASKPIGWMAVSAASLIVIVMTFPTSSPIRASSLSWSPIITLAAMFLSFITWKFYGSSHYSGPIRSITKWSAGAEIDLQSTLKDGAMSRKRADEDSFKFGDSASELASQGGVQQC